MEAAACYIGECRDPERDAKIAMNLEGAYGLFIYTMIPVSFVIVLGADQLSNAANVDPKTIFSNFASAIFGSSASWLDWAISIMLVVALSLSVLNAIMGSARAVYQMSIDGQFPRIFATVNKHGVPGFSMGFNVVVLDRARVHGRRGRDLHAVQRRVHGVVHPGAGRLLPAAPEPA